MISSHQSTNFLITPLNLRECIFPCKRQPKFSFFACMCQLFQDFDTLAKIAVNGCMLNKPWHTIYSFLAIYCFHMTYWLHTFDVVMLSVTIALNYCRQITIIIISTFAYCLDNKIKKLCTLIPKLNWMFNLWILVIKIKNPSHYTTVKDGMGASHSTNIYPYNEQHLSICIWAAFYTS